jgi:beta-1,4-mannooligosaccharide/beta-1,4-mannosyl-N-acetylglucosamine phosphorylase
MMLSRPSDNGHTPFGDIYLSQSPDMCHWGMHRLVMRRGGDQVGQWWQRTKIGAGPIPIEIEDGWLMIYHGVMDTCNGFVYSMGAAILDRDEPWRVLHRTNQHIMTPEADYEVSGHVPNVVFPCAALCDPKAKRLAIYYGAADTFSCVAYAHLDELIAFTKENSAVF